MSTTPTTPDDPAYGLVETTIPADLHGLHEPSQDPDYADDENEEPETDGTD